MEGKGSRPLAGGLRAMGAGIASGSRVFGDLLGRAVTGSGGSGAGGALAVPSSSVREHSVHEAEVEADEVSTLRSMLAMQSQQIKTLLEEKDTATKEVARLSTELGRLKMEGASVGPEISSRKESSSMPATPSTSVPGLDMSPAGGDSDLHAEIEDLKAKLKQAKDRVAFQNVDTLEQENRRLRSENSGMSKTILTLQGQLEEDSKKNELDKKRVTFLEAENKKLEEKIAELKIELVASHRETAEATKLLSQQRSKESEVQKAMEELQARYTSLSSDFDADFQFRMKEVEARHVADLAAQKSKQDVLVAEKNALAKQVVSLQKDLKKLLSSGGIAKTPGAVVTDLSSIEKQNIRLQEELARTKKSLTDAIQALQDQMAISDIKAEQLHKELMGSSKDKTMSVLLQENKTLREVTKQLTEEVKDKATLIEELKATNKSLGLKAIELEEVLGYRKPSKTAATA